MNLTRMAILAAAAGIIFMGCEKDEARQVREPDTAPVAVETKTKAKLELPGSYYYLIETETLGAKGGKSRAEYSVSGDKLAMKVYTPDNGDWKLVSHSISDGENFYMIRHDQKTVMKMPTQAGGGMGNAGRQVPVWDAYLQEHDHEVGVKDLGTVKMDGMKLRKKEFEDPDNKGSKMTFFVDDDGILRRTEYYEGNKLMTVQKFVKVDLDPDFGKEVFQPPKDYRMQDMTKVPGMENMPGMPGTE